jgi:hypothetical protein
VEVWQIGNEGGFLAAPVNMTTVSGNRLLMGSAERADVIVDFTNVPRGEHILANVGPEEPFGGGVPGVDVAVADPATAGQVLAFRVGPALSRDASTPPQYLRLPSLPLLRGGRERSLALMEMMSEHFDGAPTAAVLGTVQPDRTAGHKMWSDPVSESPGVGDTEVWALTWYDGRPG